MIRIVEIGRSGSAADAPVPDRSIGQFATHHSGWSRAKDVPRLATAIFEDRARENPGGTRVECFAGWLVSLPRTARNDLAAVLSPGEVRAMLYDGRCSPGTKSYKCAARHRVSCGTSFWALRLPKSTVLEMPLSFIEQLGSVLLSQQGVVAGLLLAAIVYLAWQLATERAARERDRETAKHEAAERTRAVEALALALAKIEGFLGRWGGPR